MNEYVESMSVTRHPGDEHHLVSKGGNTRLTTVKELYESRNDERENNVRDKNEVKGYET